MTETIGPKAAEERGYRSLKILRAGDGPRKLETKEQVAPSGVPLHLTQEGRLYVALTGTESSKLIGKARRHGGGRRREQPLAK